MHLVIDVGNTNIECGVFPAEKGAFDLKASFRLSTPKIITTDELAANLRSLLHYNGINHAHLTRAVFSSVVPPLNHNITKMMDSYFGLPITRITHQHFLDFTVQYEPATDVGIDRLVNIQAALALYGAPALVVDFGTATTLDVLTDDRRYIGGLIIPGLAVSLDSLVRNTSQLPRVELDYPKRIVARNTRENMQNGVYYLNAYGIDGMIRAIKEENFPGKEVNLVATGGLSGYITRAIHQPMKLEPKLQLMGMKILMDRLP